MVEPALVDEHRHLDLGGDGLEQSPESLTPVGVGALGVADPVTIPVKAAAPHVLVHAHLRQVEGGFHVIGVDRISGVLHGPGGEHVTAEGALLVGGGEPVGAVVVGADGGHLRRGDVRHGPAGQGQVRGAPQADHVDPVLMFAPGEQVGTVVALVDVRFPRAAGGVGAAAPFAHHRVAAPIEMFAVQLPQLDLLRVGATHHDGRVRAGSGRAEDVDRQLDAVAAGDLGCFGLGRLVFRLESGGFVLAGDVVEISGHEVVCVTHEYSLYSLYIRLSGIGFARPHLACFVISLNGRIRNPMTMQAAATTYRAILPTSDGT